VGCIKDFERFFNISLQNVEEKVGPKVFWLFVFGHFFCPFLKRGDLLSQNTSFVTEMYFYRLVTKIIISRL